MKNNYHLYKRDLRKSNYYNQISLIHKLKLTFGELQTSLKFESAPQINSDLDNLSKGIKNLHESLIKLNTSQ